MDLLEVKGIVKQFPGVKALDGVSLNVKEKTVHALMGENGAGKSTLMKCIFGIYKPDEGEVWFKGQKVKFKSSKDALDAGIAMIHQELSPVLHRSVAENIWIGRIPSKANGFFTQDEWMYKETDRFLKEEMNFDISSRTKMIDLSISQMQFIEIAKAVYFKAKVIVMDEPTSSLTENEVDVLFKLISRLRQENNTAFIYISHKMEEIKKISDEISIMRDGKYQGTWQASEMTTDQIIARMVGRELKNRFPPHVPVNSDEVVLKVENYTSINPKSFKKVSFDIKKGEILGFAGLVGAQRTEVLEAVFGMRGTTEGKVYIHGKETPIKNTLDAIKNKLALVTEDRRGNGIFPMLSIMDNTIISSIDKNNNPWFLDYKKAIDLTKYYINMFATKCPSYKTHIGTLSGGNQQKVILGRWLATEPDILILDEPTRGIDVGAKYDIYATIIELSKKGKSVIVVSSEMPELLGITDRIIVMCNGKITGNLITSQTNQEEIMKYAFQFE